MGREGLEPSMFLMSGFYRPLPSPLGYLPKYIGELSPDLVLRTKSSRLRSLRRVFFKVYIPSRLGSYLCPPHMAGFLKWFPHYPSAFIYRAEIDAVGILFFIIRLPSN